MKLETGLSEAQLILIDYLKSLHIEKDNIIMVGLMCRKKKQLWKMLWWIHDNWEKGLTQSDIMDKAQEIDHSEK